MRFSDDGLEVFSRDGNTLRQVDTCSDAALILDGFKGSLDIMRFRLVYNGDLGAFGNRAKENLELRNKFHPQIGNLCVYNEIFKPIKIGSYHFVPLVRRSLDLVCELDILFLRNDAAGSVVKSGGDLDNRIKTLFDGLRMPTAEETKIGAPIDDPCFCLLEDDSLISTFAVRTDRLLTDPQRVLLVIEVKLTLLKLNWNNVGFLKD